MNIIEIYQQKYPNLPQEQLLKLIGNEAFLRRMNGSYEPFMLKGSFVSRLYFPEDSMRLPADLDFVYLCNVKDGEKTENFFNEWANRTALTSANDYISFTKFSSWEDVDYQMHQDFPTIQGQIVATIVGQQVPLSLDISFNLQLFAEPVDMLYSTPIEDIYLPYTVPLAIQVAWKIHQSIVNPRFKDFYDLAYLAPQLTQPADIDVMLNTLEYECERDNISLEKIKRFFSYKNKADLAGLVWTNTGYSKYLSEKFYDYQYDELQKFCPNLPQEFEQFWQFYQKAMLSCEFNKYLEKFNFK